MKNILVKTLSFVLCVVLVLSFVGCSGVTVGKNVTEDFKKATLINGEKIENDKLSLTWDAKNKCIILTDKQTGAQWTTSPNGYLSKEERPAMQKKYVESPIHVKYLENYEFQDNTSPDPADDYGYTALRDSSYSIVKEENSFVISFCFKQSNSIIPVRYTLKDDCVGISIDTDEIIENEDPIYSIAFTPTFCAVEKGTKDSYMFYPSGTGALIDTSSANLLAASYSAGIYGDDAARKIRDDLTNQKNVYLPVFGTVVGSNAICGIVSSGAEHATINYTTSYEKTDYAAIYTELHLRGYDFNTIKGNLTYEETAIYAEDRLTGSVYEVEYYPLSGENASYVGMAKLYQQKLYGNNDATTITDDAFSLKIHGGLLEERNILGYPYNALLALTTYKDVAEIINDLSATGVTPNIQLYGFGQSGMDIGKVAGGFKLGSEFGSKKELKNVIALCENKGIDMFVDFNLTEYGKSSLGYNATFDSAKTANKQAAYRYYIDKAVQIQDSENYDRFRLLNRDKVLKASNTLVKKIKGYNLPGISFSTLSDTAYSDYSSDKYYVKKNMGSFVQGIVENYKNNGYAFAANGANAYAAVVADCVFETPMNSSELDVFMTDVPFYQMVFKGKTEITSEAVNAGETMSKKQLQALETGASMLFNVYGTYDSTLTYSPFKGLYGAKYSDNKDDIIKVGTEYGDYYKAISGQTIANHELITKDVRLTTYSNGVKIYVNYSDADYVSADGTVTAGGCLIIK